MKITIQILLFLLLPALLEAQFSHENIIIKSETPYPVVAIAADLDGDLDNDIIAISSGRVIWFENDNDSDFREYKNISPEKHGAQSLSVSDLDGDGDLDVLSTSNDNGENRVVWFENLDGNCNFGSMIPISPELAYISMVFAEDLDNDGDNDIVCTTQHDNKISWYENINGSGSFSSEKIISDSIFQIRGAAATDFNGDGFLEIVTGSAYEALKWFSFNDDSNEFELGGEIISDLGYEIADILSTDFDGDGDLDLIINSELGQEINWLENLDGNGNYGEKILIAENIRYVKSIMCFDVNLDGNQDIVYCGSDEVGWIQNENGSFSEKQIIDELKSGRFGFTMDLDGDFDIDVLTTSLSNDKIGWYRNEDGMGDFSEEILLSKSGIGNVESFISVDLDNDGLNDILSCTQNGDAVVWLKNEGGLGSFGPINTISDSLRNAISVCAGDIDNDGDLDIVGAARGNPGRIYLYENLDGNGNFSSGVIISEDIILPRLVYLVDVDGDSFVDLVTVSEFDKDILWVKNIDNFTQSAPPIIISVSVNWATSICAVDIDGDSHIDIISSSRNDDKIMIHYNPNNNDNYWSIDVLSSNFDGASCVYSEDIDGDGDLDIIATSRYGDKLVWFRNENDSEEFSSEIIISAEVYGASSCSAYDFDEDGDMDVIVSVADEHKVYVFENIGGGDAFLKIELEGIHLRPSAVYVEDIDNDSKLDIIVSSNIDDKISWYKNLKPTTSVSGVCYYDENENGLYDFNEIGLNNQLLSINNDQDLVWSNNGDYLYKNISDTISISCTPTSEWVLSTPSQFEIHVNEDSISYIRNFGLIPTNGNNYSASLDLATGEFGQGQNMPFWINMNNSCSNHIKTTITLNISNPLSFVSAIPAPISIDGQIIIWDINDIEPLGLSQIFIELSGNGNDIDNSDFQLNVEMEIFDLDNNFVDIVYDQIESIISYSNKSVSKSVTPDRPGDENFTLLTDTLEYKINFQNISKDTAKSVLIIDKLDDNLDWSTFLPLSSSHLCETSIDSEGNVSFLLKDIFLPDSASNNVLCKGYVTYQVLPKAGLLVNDTIVNIAKIYFDVKSPEWSNSTLNTIADEILTSNHKLNGKSEILKLFPNPFVKKFNIDASVLEGGKQYLLQIYNSEGQIIYSKNIINELITIENMNLVNGFYFYNITDIESDKSIKFGKIISL